MELDLTLLLFGSGGLAVLVLSCTPSRRCGSQRTKTGTSYRLGLLSLGAGYFALQGMGVEGILVELQFIYLVLSLFIMAFQLFSENEAWDDIKGVFLLILKTLRK